MTTRIDLQALDAGDIVTVSQGFNRIRGTLERDRNLALGVSAFGMFVVIMKRSPGNRLTLVKGLKIEDHQPKLFP